MLLEPGLHQDSHLVHPSWPKLTSFCSHGEMATKLVVCSCGNNSWLPIQYLFYSCIESEPTFHFRAMADNVLPKHLQISYGYVIISGQCHISRETSLNFVLPPTPPQSFVCVCANAQWGTVMQKNPALSVDQCWLQALQFRCISLIC